MASTQAYTINEVGIWPDESYQITLYNDLINPNLGFIPAENFFRFINNYTVPINSISNYSYLNASTVFDIDGLYQINTFSNTQLTWNVNKERRAFDIGYRFNAFTIDTLPGTKYVTKYYSYLLYPKRIFLKPTSAPVFNGNNWVLNTQTVLLNTNTSYQFSSASDVDIAYTAKKYIQYPIQTTSVPANSNYSLVYNISATRTRIDRSLINFTNTNNPDFYTTILETVPAGNADTCKLRPNSTYISYAVSFYAQHDDGSILLGSLGQQRPDTIWSILPTVKSSYISNFNPTGTNPNKQAFQLLQIKKPQDDLNIDLGDVRYCVLSGVFDISTSNFSYFNKSYRSTAGTIVKTATGIPDTSIGVSYIADCPTMQFSQETWQSTVYSVGTQLGVPINTTSIPSSIDWTTKYPPHYYSYSVSVSGSADTTNNLLETSKLTWYLYSSAVSAAYTTTNYTTSITLSTFITSDFNFISYDLVNGGSNDYIKFVPLVPVTSPFLSSLKCYYGNNLNNYYSILDTPWIPAASANNFIITYPITTHGELNFSLRPTLCTIAGYMDAYNATQINMAIGQKPLNLGQRIFISKTMETEDMIEVDSSFLISSSSWPTRDLQNSYVSWFFTPTSTFVQINAVDTNGNYLQNIPAFSAVPFNSNTWSVVVSGYGPQTTVINLSSQKYNEVTNLTSNSAYFNYFKEGRLLVGSPQGLNNYNVTRTIYLTAGVPYKGRQYNLPANTQCHWVWSYDGISDYENIPVSAYFLPTSLQTLSSYPYGCDLDTSVISAVTINAVPPFVTQAPQSHNINTILSIDTQLGLIQGTYSFDVDDFPHPSIFNTDFTAYYTAFQDASSTIVDTRNIGNVITRPDNRTNNFTFSAYGDILPNLIESTIVWNVSSENGLIQQNYSLSPINLSLSGISKTIITLSALSAFAPGWTSAHNIQTNVIVYLLDPIIFYTPLEFLTIPEFFWINGRDLILYDNTDPYSSSLIPANTAYENKTSNSQRYYLSANNSIFNDFRYYTGSNGAMLLSGVSSYYQLVDIPYQKEFFTYTGLPISLTAYNDTCYPEYNGMTYLLPINNQINSYTFNLMSENRSNDTNTLKIRPKLIPYSPITFNFNCITPKINLDNSRTITIVQTISTNPLESPVQVVDGTITYTLSTYHWSVNKDVPAVNGTYDIFQLFVGDSVFPLTVNGKYSNTLYLYASANVSKKIYPNSFEYYYDNQYTGPRDIWNTVNQTASSINTSSKIYAISNIVSPEVYLSTTYVLTGENFFLQYYTPDSLNYKTTNTLLNGLNGIRYNGDASNITDRTWFSTATPSTDNIPPHFDQELTTDFTNFYQNDSSATQPFSWEWIGVFRAPYNGVYSFFTTSKDGSYVWFGNNALNGYTVLNATVNNGGIHSTQTINSNPVYLTEGSYVPIRIQYSNSGGSANFVFGYNSNSETNMTNLVGKLFHYESLPTGYYIVAYLTDFGENNPPLITASDSTLFYNYQNKGTFYISYSALFSDGSYVTYQHPNPMIVDDSWKTYDPNSLRFVEEQTLTLPYNDNDIAIQPNEWGDADIFNTSILRLQDNLDYLASNLQTLNTSSPTILFGWMGSNINNQFEGIRWYTKDFGSDEHLSPNLASSLGTSYFTNIKDAIEINDYTFVLDSTQFRSFSAGNFAPEVYFTGVDDLNSTFLRPLSIESDDTGTIIYVTDPPKNKIYRFDMEYNGFNSILNYTLNVGGLGNKFDNNKFNSPSELAFGLGNLFVLDYNNYCIKEYNADLNWIHTYDADEFIDDIPVNIAVHPKFGFLYVLTKSNTIYIFDNLANTYFSKFYIDKSSKNILKIIFDEVGDFLYVIKTTSVDKYSSSGYFISTLNLPSGIILTGGKKAPNRSILLFTEKAIIKLQDILEIHKVGEGLPSQYWSKDQLILDRDELASDTNYNRCLIRMAQNIKMFRDSMNYRLIIATEQTATNTVEYFSSIPISVSDRPVFYPEVENEFCTIGVNELHVPETINKELVKLSSSIFLLKDFLDIKNYNIQSNNSSGGCGSQFCWSWKAMSCYNLSLPVIRICNINPITYAELESKFPINYAPTKLWGQATSECCNKVIPPV